ncbi:MAG: methionine synthase [Lachnospiraceae bacterium]|nr:methionine synthase [Lachnospiraceae bacterium]
MSEVPETVYGEIRRAISQGQPKEAERLVQRALEEGFPSAEILNQGMVEAMRQVGQQYKEGEFFIPGVLAAARAMRSGVTVLEPELVKQNHGKIGLVILGTVEGDLHDMGKNLVGIMFRCSGFEVIDLGVDVSEKQFLTALRENPQASIVCISTLLSTTLPEMRRIVRGLRQADKKKTLKIMVGGAPVTQEFADSIGADAYTENAVDAAELARSFFI